MSVRTILQWPNKELRRKSEDLTVGDLENISLATDLHDTMKVNFGLGIAAPQVGIYKNIFIVDSKELPELKEDSKLQGCVVFINPVISTLNPSKVRSVESCLSVSGVTAEVKRDMSISVEYHDLSGKLNQVEVSGRQSCIIQHEFDHLLGKIFIDRMNPVLRNRLVKNISRSKKNQRLAGLDFEKIREQKANAKRNKARAERKRKQKSKKRRT